MSKTLLVLLFIALTCISCSSDESNSPDVSTDTTISDLYKNESRLDDNSETDPPRVIYGQEEYEPESNQFADYPIGSADVEESDTESINQAKQDVIDAQSELNRSVRSLSYGDWENDLPTVQRRLRALEDANSSLSDLDSSAAADMDWEIQRMKRDVRRIEDENWRDVVPDIESRNRALNWESEDLESSIEE